MAAGVLVLANVTAASGDLIDAIKQRAAKGPIDVTLLMPGQGPGLSGKEAVRDRLDAALAAWREAGIEAAGVCGDANPMDALAETWDPRHHDEVIVSTLPGQTSRWLRWDVPYRIGALTDLPVTHVPAMSMLKRSHRGEPLPRRERAPIGMLNVMAYRGNHPVSDPANR
jgi:hypothetical protein